MNRRTKQQVFDSTVAILIRGTILEGDISILTKVMHLDTVIAGAKEMVGVLTNIRDYCELHSVPEDFFVRTNEYRGQVKNSGIKGRTTTFTALQPKSRAKKIEKAQKKMEVRGKTTRKVYHAFQKVGGPIACTSLAEKIGMNPSTVNKIANRLVEINRLKRRRAKKSEKLNGGTKYVFEVVA
jgi:hypothetical protein